MKGTKYETIAILKRFHIVYISRICDSKIDLSQAYQAVYVFKIVSPVLYFMHANNDGSSKIEWMHMAMCGFQEENSKICIKNLFGYFGFSIGYFCNVITLLTN